MNIASSLRLAAVLLVLTALGAPISASAENKNIPVVALFRSTPAAPFAELVTALRKGLEEEGFAEGRNVRLLLKWADNDRKRLPVIAKELVQGRVAVIVGNSLAVEASKDATSAIPIVFVTSDDPIERGLVKTLSRPGSNLTGVTFFGSQLGAKRLQLLKELVPGRPIALILDSNFPASKFEREDIERSANLSGVNLIVEAAASGREVQGAIRSAYEQGAGALLFLASPTFTSHRKAIVELVRRYRLPAVYDVRSYVEAGGLMSYAASFVDAYRQAGRYAGRIIHGASPSDLPVLQPAKFKFTLNLKAAREIGVSIPEWFLVQADDIIE